jgi:Domain of unknown function (DUF4440)
MKRRARTAFMAGVIAIAVAAGLTTSVVASASASPKTSHQTVAKAADHESELQVVLGLDQKYANWVVAGNVKAVSSILAPTFEMTHGNGWIDGGQPLLVQDKAQFLAAVAAKHYTCIQFDDIKAELHGNIAITYGRYLASETGQPASNAYFVVWYERVFQREGNKWIYESHRTVDGPHFGPTVAAAMDGMGPADPGLTCPAVQS